MIIQTFNVPLCEVCGNSQGSVMHNRDNTAYHEFRSRPPRNPLAPTPMEMEDACRALDHSNLAPHFQKTINRMREALIYACAALLLLALPLAAEKRPGVGYVAPSGSQVFHCDTSREVLLSRGCTPTTPLNTSVPWSGSNADTDGYVGRYLGGNRNCLGSWICGVGNENEGMRAREELVRMFNAGQLGSLDEWTGEPTRTEIHDFGGPRPDLASVGGTDALRKQPTEPVGCCRNDFPCPVDEPGRLPGEVWREPVRTPLGGRKGCYLIQVARPPEPPTDPPPPPDPPIPPTPKPDDCWLIRRLGDMLTLEKVECP